MQEKRTVGAVSATPAIHRFGQVTHATPASSCASCAFPGRSPAAGAALLDQQVETTLWFRQSLRLGAKPAWRGGNGAESRAGYLHHCRSHGIPSLFPSILVPGQLRRK